MEKKILSKIEKITLQTVRQYRRETMKMDRAELKDYEGEFIWTCDARGTMLICLNNPFSSCLMEPLFIQTGLFYAYTKKRLRQVTQSAAVELARECFWKQQGRKHNNNL